MIYQLAVHLSGALVFAFLYWRRIKEDYISSQVFSSIFIILILMLLLALIGPKAWCFWLAFLGFSLGIILSKYKFRFKFYETYEIGVISLLPWLALVFLADSIKSASLISFIAFLVVIAGIGFYNIINRRYKNFGWYRSGRIGFAGLTTLGVLMLGRGVIAIFYPFVLSFAGDFEAVLSGIVALLVSLGVYDLSRKI